MASLEPNRAAIGAQPTPDAQRKQSQVVRFLVSGEPVDIPMAIIEQWPDTFLHSAATFAIAAQGDCSFYFVELPRDLRSFRVLKVFMETRNLIIPKDQVDREILLAEAAYYHFQEVVNILTAPPRPVLAAQPETEIKKLEAREGYSAPAPEVVNEFLKEFPESLLEAKGLRPERLPGWGFCRPSDLTEPTLMISDAEMRSQELPARLVFGRDENGTDLMKPWVVQLFETGHGEWNTKPLQDFAHYCCLNHPAGVKAFPVRLVRSQKEFELQWKIVTMNLLQGLNLPLVAAGGCVLAALHELPREPLHKTPVEICAGLEGFIQSYMKRRDNREPSEPMKESDARGPTSSLENELSLAMSMMKFEYSSSGELIPQYNLAFEGDDMYGRRRRRRRHHIRRSILPAPAPLLAVPLPAAPLPAAPLPAAALPAAPLPAAALPAAPLPATAIAEKEALSSPISSETKEIETPDPDEDKDNLFDQLAAAGDDPKAIAACLGISESEFGLEDMETKEEKDGKSAPEAPKENKTRAKPAITVELEEKQLQRMFNSFQSTDIDLFLTTRDPDEAFRTIVALYKHLKRVLPASVDIFIVRTAQSVTFLLPRPFRKIQVILRLYHSLEHVLLGFDIDCCCVGYDLRTKKLLALPRAVRALTQRYNLVDPTRQSTTYEKRLVKYIRRNFDVALAHPNITAEVKQTQELILAADREKSYTAFTGLPLLLAMLYSIRRNQTIGRQHLLPGSDYGPKQDFSTEIWRAHHEKRCTDFASGYDIFTVLLDSKAVAPKSVYRRRRWRVYSAQNLVVDSTVGKNIAFLTVAPHKQDRVDYLFTGSFNPSANDWGLTADATPKMVCVLSRGAEKA